MVPATYKKKVYFYNNMDYISCIITPENSENNELILTFALINLKKIKL